MKPEIHPEYKQIKVTCSCGNTFETGSTINRDLHIEICSKCHPFYTGTQKLIDTAGRVDRFRQKYSTAAKPAAAPKAAASEASAPKAEAPAKAASASKAAPKAKAAKAPSAKKASESKTKAKDE